jgi:hypothetical protein
MWIVYEEAVYRHRIVALCDSLTGAEDRAREESMKGPVEGKFGYPGDGHHDYVVATIPINELVNDVVEVCSYNKGVRRGG